MEENKFNEEWFMEKMKNLFKVVYNEGVLDGQSVKNNNFNELFDQTWEGFIEDEIRLTIKETSLNE